MWHVWRRDEVRTGFDWENLKEGDHLEDPGLNERIILKWIFREVGLEWHGLDRSG